MGGISRELVCLSSSLALAALIFGMGLRASPALAQAAPQTAEGYALLDKGWVNDAIAAFESALRRQPNSPEARLGLAIAYQRAGRDGDAWQAYRAVLAVSPENATALAALGELGGYRPEWQGQGIAALSQLLEQNPGDLAARRQRALLYGYQGRFSQAIADYEPLLAREPAPETLLGAAQVYAFSGDYPTALDLFNRYRATAAIPPQALMAYALALQETGDVPGAIALLEPQLSAASGPQPDLRAALANAYDASGQTDRALALLEPLGNAPGDRLARARAYSAIGRRRGDAALFEQATTLYQQALAASAAPSYGLRVEVAAVLSEGSATLPQAQAIAGSLAAENPDVVSLAVQERLLAYRLGREEAAVVAEQLLPRLTPPPAAGPERRAIAAALLRVENPDPALVPVYAAVASTGESPPLTDRLAQLYLAQGQPEAALAAYRSALDAASGPNAARLALGYALVAYRTGLLSAAEAAETLAAWQASQSLDNAPPELVALVAALPPSGDRAELYQRLLAQRPDDLGLRWRTIQLLAETDPARAQAELAALAAAYPQAIAVDFFRGELAQTQGDLEAAAAAYGRVLAQEPENLAARRALAGVAFQQGDLAAARDLYRQVLARDPNDWQARYAIAELDLARDQKLAGLEQLRQIPAASAPANLEQRASDVEFDLLRRRGFQPTWERY